MVMVLLLPLMVGVWADRLPAQADRIIASAKMENAVFMGNHLVKRKSPLRVNRGGQMLETKKDETGSFAHLVPSIAIHTLIRSAMQGQNDAIGEFFLDLRQDATFNRDENTLYQRHIFTDD